MPLERLRSQNLSIIRLERQYQLLKKMFHANTFERPKFSPYEDNGGYVVVFIDGVTWSWLAYHALILLFRIFTISLSYCFDMKTIISIENTRNIKI